VSFSEDDLYRLLPAIYRIQDESQGGAIKALLSVIAEQVKAIDEDLSQLYDDHFIETCASWAVPYIGDLIGARGLDPKVTAAFSQRAAVANTLAYRRRKGTAAILEQLAQDVMGIPAKAVEYFRLITATQNLNHIRSACLYSPNLRDRSLLQDLDTPFDRASHSVDVRRISVQRGRYNIANIGIFLWRLQSYPLTKSIACPVDRRRFLFSTLGNDAAIYSQRESEENIAHLAEKLNIPMPITRQMLGDDLDAYYGRNRSLLISVGGKDVLPEGSNDLSDILGAGELSDIMDSQGNVTGWSGVSSDKIVIDPVRGRISFPKDQEDAVQVTYHYGFSSTIGGGEYERLDSLDGDLTPVIKVASLLSGDEQKDYANIQDALNGLKGDGAVEIADSGCYYGPLVLDASGGKKIELRADDKCRPVLDIGRESCGMMDAVSLPGTGLLEIHGDENSEVSLNGLVITGGSLKVTGPVSKLLLQHCTLVPGLRLRSDGSVQFGNLPSIIIESDKASVEVNHCISGGIEAAPLSQFTISNSIIDACSIDGTAYSGQPMAAGYRIVPGGSLNVKNCTIIGKVHSSVIEASNSIFFSVVDVENRQKGCIRFSYLPWTSNVPRRYRCQPKDEASSAEVMPQFTSTIYGRADYCQLSVSSSELIKRGSDDGSEMGAFHDLFLPEREANLRLRLREYLRFGLEAGIFYIS
jgi:hypothetical protein